MKKKLLSLLLSVCTLFGGAFTFSSCNDEDITNALDKALEFAEVKEKLENLTSGEGTILDMLEELESEIATYRFYDAFPNGVIESEDNIELINVNLKVKDTVNGGDTLTIKSDVKVTINGGSYDGGQTPFGGAGNTAIWCNSKDAHIIINNGYFTIGGLATDSEGNKDTGHIDLIYCSQGTIEINGGWFEGENSDVWLLNCKDNAYKDGIAKIIVKGGTFVNFDPSNCTSEGENTNFVAEGYKVEEEILEGVVYYKVVPIENITE